MQAPQPGQRTETSPTPLEAARALILSDPDFVLSDPEIMRALLGPKERADRKIVDLRAALVDRLERRLARLVEAHRDIVDAAWDNMTGMEQAHLLALALLDAGDEAAVARVLADQAPEILQIDAARLVLIEDEPAQRAPARRRPRLRSLFGAAPRRDAVRDRLGAREAEDPVLRLGRRAVADLVGSVDGAFEAPDRPQDPRLGRCACRFADFEARGLFTGPAARELRSFAVVGLSGGDGAPIGALLFGARDAERFAPGRACDLLAFLGRVAERALRSS